MVMHLILAAQPAIQAVVGMVFSAEGIVTLTGFYWVVYQALYGVGGGAVLGGLYNAAARANNGGGGGGGAVVESPLVRFARPVQVLLTVTLLGLFFKWPLTSTLFVALWIGIFTCTNVASAFFSSVMSPNVVSSTTTTSTAPPTGTPFLEAAEGLLPSSLVDAAAAAATASSRSTSTVLPSWSPWMWLGLSIVGSWILCAFLADLLEDSARTLQRNVKRFFRYLLWTAPKQLARCVVRSILWCVRELYLSAIRPAVVLCFRTVRHGYRWIRGGRGGGPGGAAAAATRGGDDVFPHSGRRPYHPPARTGRVRERNMDPYEDDGRAIVINNTGSQDDDDEHDSGNDEPVVRTLINYWRDPSNKAYWDDNDDDDRDDEDYVDHEGRHDDDDDDEFDDDDEYDHDLSMVDFEEEEELDVTPRRSSRLWERGL